MANETISVELTPEQLEKVKILEEKGISVGRAIDLLFEAREGIEAQNNNILRYRMNEVSAKKEELTSEIERLDQKLEFYNKLMDTNVSISEKQKMVEKEYSTADETYDVKVQKAKQNISWVKDFIKF